MQLSRVTEVASLAMEGSVTLGRFQWGTSKAKQAIAVEDLRLYKLHERTLQVSPGVTDKWEFEMVVHEAVQMMASRSGGWPGADMAGMEAPALVQQDMRAWVTCDSADGQSVEDESWSDYEDW